MTIGSVQGLLLRARIHEYKPGSSKVTVYIESKESVADYGNNEKADPSNLVEALIPLSWTGINGEFIGGYPTKNNKVLIGKGQGGEWFILSYLPSEGVFQNKNTSDKNSLSLNKLINLKEGRVLLQTEANNYIYIDKNSEVGTRIGGISNNQQINPYLNIISHNFNQEYAFTEASRYINGVIKRDIKPNNTRGISSSMLDSQEYDKTLVTINMDSLSPTSYGTPGTPPRNIPLCENRELTYEFANSFDYSNDQLESEKYLPSNSQKPSSDFKINRYKSRADALTLNLNESNQLIETIKGTCVDVYGNVLDINRNPLLIGKKENLSLKQNADKKETFLKIREQLRKSIAFHFEINTRKSINIPDANSKKDYARERSRFFLDIDKEGQFKLNVPSSSETGNISFLTRYENFSVISNKKNPAISPTEFLKNPDSKDIYADSFATDPKINIKNGDKKLDGLESPIDRLTSKPMLYGTAYHDITKVLEYRNLSIPAGYGANNNAATYDPDLNSIISRDVSYINLYKRPIVSNEITISGESANAGGRSGTLNFDGSLSFNIGANTVDRQSLWLDCAGGMVSTLGRDKNGISHAVRADGDINIFIGGSTLNNDSRFNNSNDIYNGLRSGNLDIRVWSPIGLNIVRITETGVSVLTPGQLNLVSKQDVTIKSLNGDLKLYGQTIYMYAGEQGSRVVLRNGQQI